MICYRKDWCANKYRHFQHGQWYVKATKISNPTKIFRFFESFLPIGFIASSFNLILDSHDATASRCVYQRTCHPSTSILMWTQKRSDDDLNAANGSRNSERSEKSRRFFVHFRTLTWYSVQNLDPVNILKACCFLS